MKKNDKEFGQAYAGTAAAVAGKMHLITSIFIAKKINPPSANYFCKSTQGNHLAEST